MSLEKLGSSRAEIAVSICVVTYNHLNYIDDCLQGCVDQSLNQGRIEVIVCDDGSSDGTAERILEWQRRYPEIINPVLAKRNQGIARNFNAALEAFRGRYLCWLGGDDIILPGKVQAQFDLMERCPDASGCYHDAEVFASPGDRVLGAFSSLYGGRAATLERVGPAEMLDPTVQMLPSTLMLRRPRADARFDTRLTFHNDFLFDFIFLEERGPLVRMEGTYTRYRKHEASIGVSASVDNRILEENLIVNGILLARYPHHARRLRRRERYYMLVQVLRAAKSGDMTQANNFARAVRGRGFYLSGAALLLGGVQILALLGQPRWRALAIRLRSMFA